MLKVFDKVPKVFGRNVRGLYIKIISERRKKMNLGENILKLRKKQDLSQEQLGEKVNVTRQTISNWELNETSPNPTQLKLLSKALNISIDELLDNESKEALMTKVSNTEKLAGIIIKILKVFVIIFIAPLILVLIAIICLGIATYTQDDNPNAESSATIICSMNDEKYQVEFGTNNYFKCDNCSNEMENDLRKITNFDNMSESINNIKEYFKNNNGTCE